MGYHIQVIAALLIGTMYVDLSFSLAEMSPALPHTHSAYSFARSAMGPWGGFVTRLTEKIEYMLTPAAISHFDFSRWALNIGVGSDGAPMELPAGGGSFLPFGWMGVLTAMPFAVWLFLAIEQLPLAAEESHDPVRDIPKGLLFGIATLVFSAFMVLFLNSGIAVTNGCVRVGQEEAHDHPTPLEKNSRTNGSRSLDL